MLILNDGRSELWQWDTGRALTVDAECSQVHFSNKVFGRSIDVDVTDGVAIIPDVLLQSDKDLNVWAFVGTPENGYTKISKTFKVNRRNKPSDYVFTSTEQTTLEELSQRIDQIEESQDETIKNAVEEYIEQNPVVPDLSNYATKDEIPDVSGFATKEELPVVPEALPNPNALTFTGAVNAVYDGSEAVSVEIPSGGSGTDISLGLTSAAVGQAIKVKAVDESGKPTEWEAADVESGGGESALRLVVDTTTTEDVARIEFTEDLDGNPLKLKKFIFNIEVPPATGSANSLFGVSDYRWLGNADTPQYDWYGVKSTSINTSKVTWWGEFCLNIEKDGKYAILYKRATKIAYSNLTDNSDGGTYHRFDVRYAPYSSGGGVCYFHETIDRIFFDSNSATVMVPAGTKIKIWGVDA